MDPCAAAVWPYFKLLRKAKFYFFAATLFAGTPTANYFSDLFTKVDSAV